MGDCDGYTELLFFRLIPGGVISSPSWYRPPCPSPLPRPHPCPLPCPRQPVPGTNENVKEDISGSTGSP